MKHPSSSLKLDRRIVALGFAAFVVIVVSQIVYAALPFMLEEHAYGNLNLEDDGLAPFVSGSNVSFQINVTDDDNNLANSSFEFNGANYTVNVTGVNMTAWVTFNEPGFNASDRTGQYSLTTYNSPAKLDNSIPGFGRSMIFDDTDDFVSINGTSTKLRESFTVAFWVNVSTEVDSVDKIVQKYSESGGNAIDGFNFLYTDSGTVRLNIRKGGSTTAFVDSGVVQNNSWYHIVGTFNNKTGDAALYVNGTLIDTDTGGSLGVNSQDILIGRSPNSADHWSGGIDDVRIWERVLTSNEIANIYFAQRGGVNTSEVYVLPDGNQSSTFFVNISTPSIGIHKYRWHAADFANGRNSSYMRTLILTEGSFPFFTLNSTYYKGNLQNDNVGNFRKYYNLSFEVNVSDTYSNHANATFEFNGVNYTTISQDGLVAWWRMNEGGSSLNITDATGNGNNLVVTDMVNISWGTGKFGPGLVYNNTFPGGCSRSDTDVGALMNPTLKSIFPGNNFSLTVWFNASANAFTIYHLTNQFSASAHNGLWIRRSGSNIIAGINNQSSRSNNVTGSTQITNGAWYHLAYVQNGTHQTLYLNGSYLNAAEVYGSYGSLTDFHIGLYHPTCTDGWRGMMDESRVYNRSLTPDEVKRMFEAGYGGSVHNHVYEYPDGNFSSKYFINISTPAVGSYNFRWIASDFFNQVNASTVNIFTLIMNPIFFNMNNTYYAGDLENDNADTSVNGANVSFEVNVTQANANLANATFEYNGVNYTGVSTEGLVAWYKLNEGTGTAIIDGTGGGNNGTFGTGTSNPEWISNSSCAYGNCVAFDGSNDYINLGNSSALSVQTNLTIAGWFTNAQGGNRWAVSKWKSGTAEGSYLLIPSYTGFSPVRPCFFVTNGSTSSSLCSTNTVENNTLFHLAATFTSGSLRIYINGELENSGTTTITRLNPNRTHPVVLGQESTLANVAAFKGIMDDVRIYNRTLNATEIRELYQAKMGGGYVNRVYEYPDGNSSSKFFINISEPTGSNTFRWHAADFYEAQNQTHSVLFSLIALVEQSTTLLVGGKSIYSLTGLPVQSGTAVGVITETGNYTSGAISGGSWKFNFSVPATLNNSKFSVAVFTNDTDGKSGYYLLTTRSSEIIPKPTECRSKIWRFAGNVFNPSTQSPASGTVRIEIEGTQYSNSTSYSSGVWEVYVTPCLIIGDIFDANIIFSGSDGSSGRMTVRQVAV